VDEGRYEVLRRLGSGGFGVVYEVRATLGGFHRAMKVLSREQTTRVQVQRRFLREAQILDRLDHPHIVRCYGVGVLAETGQPYMLLELLRGQNLQELLWPAGAEAPRPLEPARALEIAIQIAAALVEAHALPLLHRDLKPSNVVVTQSPEGQELVKVIDFGIARIMGTDTVDLTTQHLLGTPEYMAPEQLNPERPLDARMDLWQLGAVLHFMLTGQPPYTRHGPESSSDPLVIYQQQRSREGCSGPRPSERAPTMRAHPRLDAFVGRLLSTEPERRPDDAQAALAALEALRDTHHLPSDEPPEPASQPDPAASRAGLGWFFLGVALILGAALAAGAWWWAARPSPCLYTVIGQPSVYPGEPAALRAGAWHPERNQWIRKGSLTVSLVRGEEEVRVFEGRAGEDGLADINAVVPPWEAGPAAWRFEWAEGDQRWEHEVEVTLAAPGRVVAARSWPRRPPPSVPDAQERDRGVVKIELIPEGGAMINGLRTTLFVLTTERATGRPIPAKVQIEAVEGLLEEPSPAEVTTDSGGLAWFTVTPVQEVRWRLTTRSLPPEEHPDPSLSNALPVALPLSPVDAPLAANPTGERVVRLSSQARQIALVSYDPVWEEGKQLQAAVLSLRREGPFYADVYIAERWQVATRERLGPLGGGLSVAQRTTLRPSQGEVWLARLQVYLDPARPERAGDSLFVALPSAQMTRGEVLRALLKEAEARRLRPDVAAALLERDWPATASYDELQKQIAFWLGQLPDDLTAPVLLSDPALQRAR
jgi:tRNA A-37 threonylcarbamoyl transferase component Bud32